MINKEKIKTALFFLEYLANEDEEFIDSNDHEFLGEDENGCGGVCTLKITDMAADAVEIINHLISQRDKLLAALKKVRPMISQECGCTSDFEEVGLKIIDDAIAKCEAQP